MKKAKGRGVSVPSEWADQKHKPMVQTRGDAAKVGKSGIEESVARERGGRHRARKRRAAAILEKARKGR